MDKKLVKVNFSDMDRDFRDSIEILLRKYYDVEISEDPDFLFYSCNGAQFLKYQNCVKIFLTGEYIFPNFNDCDYAQGFDYIHFGDRYFRKMYLLPERKISDRSCVTDDFFNRSFCNFIYRNSYWGTGSQVRQEFCKKLMKYKNVDCPGKVLNNMKAPDLAPRDGNWLEGKYSFLRKYKFTIAFENSSGSGYTTEKLVQPFQSFSIPIYWGNPKVTKDFNPKAFINCNDYDNDFDAVIERVKELDNDPDKYLAMLRENPMQPDFDFNQQEKFEKWICSIIEKGNKPFLKEGAGFSTKSAGELILCLKKENLSLKSDLNKLESRMYKNVIHFAGDLGNQMFQYAFGQSLKTDVAYDLSWYKKCNTPFELDFFSIPSLTICPVNTSFRSVHENPVNIYNPEFFKIQNASFSGYFQCFQYVDSIREKLLTEFVPSKEINLQNQKILNLIKNTNSVSISVRRGDYLYMCPENVLNSDYYQRAIAFISAHTIKPYFFIFSDDIPWIKENLKIDFPFTIVDINHGKDSPWDLWLMKHCKHNIISNNSFSWWGAWLNENPNKIVIAPKVWFKNEKTDIVPDDWIRIEN